MEIASRRSASKVNSGHRLRKFYVSETSLVSDKRNGKLYSKETRTFALFLLAISQIETSSWLIRMRLEFDTYYHSSWTSSVKYSTKVFGELMAEPLCAD